MRNNFAPQIVNVPAVEQSSATLACAIIWRIAGCVAKDLRRTVKYAKASATSRVIFAALRFANTMGMNALSVVWRRVEFMIVALARVMVVRKAIARDAWNSTVALATVKVVWKTTALKVAVIATPNVSASAPSAKMRWVAPIV
jgi:hypothetical protein